MNNSRRDLLKRQFDKLDWLRQEESGGDHGLMFEDVCQLMDLAGGYQPGDLEWLCSIYTITFEITDKGRQEWEEIVTRHAQEAQAKDGIVTRLCACGCGQQLVGNGKRRFATDACKQRFYRAAHQG